MNSKPEYQKYKQVSLTDGQLIGAQTYFSFRLYIAYEGMENCYDSQIERFRDLICNAEIIEGFTENDYRQLSVGDLEIIAGEMLADSKSAKDSSDSVFTD